jgi:hypothetical protein
VLLLKGSTMHFQADWNGERGVNVRIDPESIRMPLTGRSIAAFAALVVPAINAASAPTNAVDLEQEPTAWRAPSSC